MADTKGQRWPTFLIVGVAKAGTTSLWGYLRQHPQVFMSPLKETNYFAYEGEDTRTFSGRKPYNEFSVKTRHEYLALFDDAAGALAIGEASPLYFESREAAERIHRALPDVKIMVILRNPVDRAVSDYMMWLRRGRVTWDAELELREDKHIVQVGFYHDKLKRYFDRFPREHIKVALFDDLQADTLRFAQDVFRYLSVDPGFEPDVAHSVGGVPKNRALHALQARARRNRFLNRVTPAWARALSRVVQKRNLDRRFVLPPHLRQRLQDLYREDILRAGILVQRDLTRWLGS